MLTLIWKIASSQKALSSRMSQIGHARTFLWGTGFGCRRSALLVESGLLKRALLVVLFPFAGCASPGVHPLQPLEIATVPYKGIPTTAYAGSLMYEGGCLLFRDEHDRMRLFPVWPDGTTFNGTSVFFHEPARAEQRIVLTEEILLEGQPLVWSNLPGPRIPLHQQRCGGTPFAVLRVRPAN
jgi:hypothetical protein